MPRTCTICSHAQRQAIDTALIAHDSLRDIAGRYGVSKSAVERHKDDHLPARMVKAHERHDVRQAIDIVQQLKAVNTACWQVLSDARASRDGELVLKASDRIAKHIELQAKLIGELEQEGTTTIIINQQVQHYTVVLMQALAPFPDARAAVAAALEVADVG